MAGPGNYKGPFRVVIRVDGSLAEQVHGSGLDWQGAEQAASRWVGQPHVESVRIENEPDSHTVSIEYQRGQDADDGGPEASTYQAT